MKTTFKNILLILLLVVVNVGIFVFCKITFDEQNYIWRKKVEPETLYMLESACLDNFRIHYFLYSNAINLFLFSLYALSWNRLLAYVLMPLSLLLVVGGRYYFDDNISKNYYTIFKYQLVPEGYKMQPIQAAGKGIGHYLLEDAQNDYSTHRVHAIKGLGIIRYEPATSALRVILEDSTEQVSIRKESYLALKKIKTTQSEKIISDFLNQYQDTEGELLKMELAGVELK
ncbi:MAG: HEAT repeat domain-containing protein [Cytophagaceae bacterium]|nr:HEAT repeat domain-containing protein [Cytophagaceae bacterium]MDW8456778.1 HEAT repeat domain-containing protein [Cytophagaceae bacterium]